MGWQFHCFIHGCGLGVLDIMEYPSIVLHALFVRETDSFLAAPYSSSFEMLFGPVHSSDSLTQFLFKIPKRGRHFGVLRIHVFHRHSSTLVD